MPETTKPPKRLRAILEQRRRFLRQVGLGAIGTAAMAIAGPVWLRRMRERAEVVSEPWPIESFGQPLVGQTAFSGDEPTQAHAFLWNKAQELDRRGGIPFPSESVDVVVVGGGVAGLTATYRLSGHSVLLLEQARQLGGNAKAENWDGVYYSIGAAYIGKPTGEFLKFLHEIGLGGRWRVDEKPDHEVAFGRSDPRVLAGFWSGSSDPRHAGDFAAVQARILEIGRDAYPAIPVSTEELRGRADLEHFFQLDRRSFQSWLDHEFGSRLHPHVFEFFEHYCWSSFGASCKEVSAAQALSFLSSDLSGYAVFPGGNSAITQALSERVIAVQTRARVRTGSMVVDVREDGDGVLVTYLQSQDGRTEARLTSVRAKACVFCGPKFVAKKVIEGIPQAQIDAMERLRYRAYVVINILLNERVRSTVYDLYRIRGVGREVLAQEAASPTYTDMIFSQWVNEDRSPRSVLTLYRPYPFDGARALLLGGGAFESVRSQIENLLPEVLALAGVGSNAVAGIRLTRWGHPMVLAEPGLIADGVVELAAAPVGGRIFFAQQDNWANPSSETAWNAANQAAIQVKQVL